MRVRLAIEEDHPWINNRYEQAGFLASNFSKETIAVAEIDGRKAGVGRLIPIDDNSFELGGIYVEEFFRGTGVAKSVIDFLLARAKSKIVYCIPLAHVVDLYRSIGFSEMDPTKVPQEVLDKFKWCEDRYPGGVGLLAMKV
ncbi:MAG: GNAT family N-acetyltransferase [Bdellovibrionales bacterium]|nr:GNAT family N-acetyltransferase [Bdellovibrionales bacterium]